MRRSTQSLAADRLLRRFYEASTRVRSENLTRLLVSEESATGDVIHIDGTELANFSSCSYLGLGNDRRLGEAAKEAIDRFGTSYSSSAAYTAVGLYGDLRPRLEAMFGAPVAVAPTTTLAHISALPVLIRSGETAIMDAYAHTSLHLTSQLLEVSGVEVLKVGHSDLAELETMAKAALEAGAPRVWYLADGVYSMAGDVAPVAELLELLDRIPDMWLYLDDAHGFSWTGDNGRGLMLASDWHPRMVISVGFAKSFGTVGGAVAALDAELIDRIELCGAPLSFGGPIPPPMLGASIASADIHLSDEHDELEGNLRRRLALTGRLGRELGVPFASFEPTPIWFLEVGTLEMMLDMCHAMWDDGFYVNPAAWPAVPQGQAGVRFTITNANSEAQITSMLQRLAFHFFRLTGATRIEIDLGAEATADIDQ